MAENKPWNESLDDLLLKLNNGEFIDSTAREFEKVIDDTVLSAKQAWTRASSTTSSSTTTRTSTNTHNAYKLVKPFVASVAEYGNYDSRFAHVESCLRNIVYDNYPEAKAGGHREAVKRYLDLAANNRGDLRTVENQLNIDLKTIRSKKRNNMYDDYLEGYYDALTLIKKVLYNSKIARLQQLSNKISK